MSANLLEATNTGLGRRTSQAPVRQDFSKIKTAVPIPNLIEIQRDSYNRFLQMDLLPEERVNTGLQSVFQSVFPISDFRETATLDFVEYQIGNWQCKCGNLEGLKYLRAACKSCAREDQSRSAAPGRNALSRLRHFQFGASGTVPELRRAGRPEAQARSAGVSGARHELQRAAEGQDSAHRLRQGSGHGHQVDPRHQGRGSLLRRNSFDDRQRHVHHQRN